MPSETARKKIARAVREAGHAALPQLLRSFVSTVEAEASWAYYLLGRLGGERVVTRLERLVRDPAISDEVKARALGLLSDLDAPVPRDVALQDPEKLLSKSVRELLHSLDSPREMAQAVTLILEQVPEAELPPFAAELMKHGGPKALPLMQALCERRDLSPETRRALWEMKRIIAASPSERAAEEALDRGLQYLESGKPRAAVKRLKRYVSLRPGDAEGHSALGVALLQIDQPANAIAALETAARLEPDEPLHRWNVAAACKQSDRMGGAYLSLREYLKLTDDGAGARDRQKEAKGFVRAYERMLRESHPGVELTDYLRGEELFASAYAALSEGRADDARTGFEQVLALVPRHYPSWGNLGAAHLALCNRDEARRCLDRALELNPEYTIARRNLQLLESLPSA